MKVRVYTPYQCLEVEHTWPQLRDHLKAGGVISLNSQPSKVVERDLARLLPGAEWIRDGSGWEIRGQIC